MNAAPSTIDVTLLTALDTDRPGWVCAHGVDLRCGSTQANLELVRDMVAMMNLPDGGLIVIPTKGSDGQDRSTFVPSRLREMLRRYIDVPIAFTYRQYLVDGHGYVVLTVHPNADNLLVPFAATASFRNANHTPQVVFTAGSVVVREGASTVPARYDHWARAVTPVPASASITPTDDEVDDPICAPERYQAAMPRQVPSDGNTWVQVRALSLIKQGQWSEHLFHQRTRADLADAGRVLLTHARARRRQFDLTSSNQVTDDTRDLVGVVQTLTDGTIPVFVTRTMVVQGQFGESVILLCDTWISAATLSTETLLHQVCDNVEFVGRHLPGWLEENARCLRLSGEAHTRIPTPHDMAVHVRATNTATATGYLVSLDDAVDLTPFGPRSEDYLYPVTISATIDPAELDWLGTRSTVLGACGTALFEDGYDDHTSDDPSFLVQGWAWNSVAATAV